MRLQTFYDSGLEYDLNQIIADPELTIDIQKILIAVGLLGTKSHGNNRNKADGKFGVLTTAAFQKYQKLTKCPKNDILDQFTAGKLVEYFTEIAFRPTLNLGDDLAGRVVKYMIRKGYNISCWPGTHNIVYIEGVDLDGKENADEINHFNDLRMVIQIDADLPKIVGSWEATTEPGIVSGLKNNGIKSDIRIRFGQYKAWQVGEFIASFASQDSLVQQAPIMVYKDENADGVRTGDNLEKVLHGINQNHANDAPITDVNIWGMGGLVGRTASGHRKFMEIILQDIRYQQNKNYMFETTIIAGDDLNKKV
jgi:hypothetical protein